MNVPTAPDDDRQDLHNASVSEEAAAAGGCGQVHLPTGRTCTLEVEFRNHRVYRYVDVPPEDWMGLTDAESSGAYFSAHIRNDYECWRLVNLARAKHRPA